MTDLTELGLTRAERLSSAFESFFGFDFFISYAWIDGRQYAVRLRNNLASSPAHFRCFVDSKEMGGGTAWRQAVRHALRRSAALIVIGSEGGIVRDAVFEEIRFFAQLGRPIIPIDFDGHVAGLDPGHRLYTLIECRLRTVEPRGVDALRDGVVDSAILEFLESSFSFIRVERIRTLVLSGLAIALTTLLCVAVANYFGERAARHLAESRERDAAVSAVRFATVNGDYQSAASILDASKTTDTRLRWGRWIISQHVAPASTLIRPLPGGEQLNGIKSLAYESHSGVLAALSSYTTEVRSQECLEALNDFAKESSKYIQLCRPTTQLLIALDATSGVIRAEMKVADDALSLAAGKAAGEFYVARDRGINRYTFSEGKWHEAPLHFDGVLMSPVLFSGQNEGFAISNGLQRIVISNGIVSATPVASLPAGGYITQTPLGEAVAVMGNKDGERLGGNIVAIAAAGKYPEPLKLPDGANRPMRLLDGSHVGWLNDDDSSLTVYDLLHGTSVTTRSIHFKPWLGEVLIKSGVLLVQEVGDESHEARARFASLDLATGTDITAGFLSPEPIWATATADAGRLLIAGQGSWLLSVQPEKERVRSIVGSHRMEAPLAITGGSQLEARRALDLDHNRVVFDIKAMTSFDVEKPYASVGHDLPNGGVVRYHDCPAIADVSPDGKMIAFGGDSLVIATLDDTDRVAAKSGALNVGEVCQKVLSNEVRIIWRVAGVDPPQNLRWVDSKHLLLHGFHGYAELVNVVTRKVSRLFEEEAVTGLSRAGPVLVSTLSGTVYRVEPGGASSIFARLKNLHSLYALDDQGIVFFGAMKRPQRTSLLVMQDNSLQEVAAIPGIQPLLDARVVGNRAVLLYANSVRIYMLPK